MEIGRLRKPVRIGYWRRGQFKPAATIGVSSDGGIFVAPAAMRDFGWTYGVAERPGSVREYDHVTIAERPKIHYHASGRAFVTMTGTRLPRREMRLRPIASIQEAQIFSVVVHRTWELATRPVRLGDVILVEDDWPWSGAFAVSVVDTSGLQRPAHPELHHLAPVDLRKDDDSTFLVDLGWYVPNKVLAVRCLAHREPEGDGAAPSIAVAALPKKRRKEEPPRSVLALWTSNVANPIVAQFGREELVTRSKISAPDIGTFVTRTRESR